MNEPTVSVLIACYNHEKYVREAIDSVMNQTMTDFELWITDDGSTDHSRDIIRDAANEYGDSRIHLLLKEENSCFSCIEEAFFRMIGKYITAIGGDDMMMPDKLTRQVQVLEGCDGRYRACFTWPEIDGGDLDVPDGYKHIFDVSDLSREEMLHRMFVSGNFLCAPSAMICRDVFEEFDGFDYSIRQAQDYELWLKLLMKYELTIIPERLIKYRVLEGSLAHSVSSMKIVCGRMEDETIRYEQMRDMPSDLFVKAFPDSDSSHQTDEDIMCRKVLALLEHPSSMSAQQAGVRLYYHYRSNKSFLNRLEQAYGLSRAEMFREIERKATYAHVLSLQNEVDVLNYARQRHRFDKECLSVSDPEMVDQLLDMLDNPAQPDNCGVTLDHLCALYEVCKQISNGQEYFVEIIKGMKDKGVKMFS